MAQITFEERLQDFELNGTCDLYEVPWWRFPVTMIRHEQQWGARFKWTTDGGLNYMMAGEWHLQIFLESVGGAEFSFPPGMGEAKVRFESEPYEYDKDIEIPAEKVPDGVYRLVASIVLLGPTNVPGPVAGFAEGPMVKFYTVGP